MGMIIPTALKPGDHVALIAPARAVSPDEIMAFENWCLSQHLVLKKGRHLFGRLHQFSGTAEERAADLREAWLDPAVKAVFCARGGYGSVHLLDLLHDLDWLKNPKWLVGFSDITTLHLHLNNLGLATLHAPMAIHWNASHEHATANISNIERALFNNQVEINLTGANLIKPQPFSGDLCGGNLSLIYAALGTPEQPKTQGKVLFLEDLDEYLYHIDRMMTALKRAGLLHGLSALLIGGMSDMKDNTVPFGYSAAEIILTACRDYDYPVIFDFPAGHTEKNICLKLGAHCTFDGQFFRQ